ncbi:hypothetical protein L6R52_16980 [Myxococcota bacterium]|nr:hypothetical protein [Myxococcota bacterium]
MVASFNAVFSSRFARNVEPIYLVRIYVGALSGGVEGTDFFTFASKFAANLGYPASVSSVSSFALELDPVTRTFRTGNTSVLFKDDPAIRRLIVDHWLARKVVDVFLGDVGMSEGSFERMGRFVIRDIRKPDTAQILFEIVDPVTLIKHAEIDGWWINQHPLEILDDVLTRAGLSSLYDAASLDPETYDTSISHWNVSRTNKQVPNILLGSGLKGKENASTIIDQLLTLLGGSFIPDEDGVYTFRRYDAGQGIERTWRSTDVGDVRQVSSHDNTQNELSVTFGRSELYPEYVHTRRDETSISDLSISGVTDGVIAAEPIDTPWLNGIAYTTDTITPGATSFIVRYAGVAGICGCHYPSSAIRPTWAEPSNDRLVYVRLEIAGQSVIAPEIISINDITLSGLTTVYAEDGTTSYRRDLEFHIKDRALFGTEIPLGGAGNWGNGLIVKVVDLTIPIALAQQRLERFSRGAEILEVTTDLRQLDLSVGDFVAIVDDEPVGRNLDGSDASDTWEIIRKEVLPLDDSPRIQWTLCRVGSFEGSIVDESPTGTVETEFGDT